MALRIVSLNADRRLDSSIYCGSAACLSRAVDKSFLTANQFSVPWLKLQNSLSGSYKPSLLRYT